ncbi:MAG: DUF1285 domain-containing protein [Syntrophomonadaceae bacterium]|nr:DUF1285 domain-containing protein [Syntrophomonadaceae bacterium]
MLGETREDYDISIDGDGVWFYRGAKMFRQPVVSFLASRLKMIDNQYYICHQEQTVPVAVEDVPFVIITTSMEGGVLKGSLADGREVIIPEQEILLEGDVPYFSLFWERDSKFSRPAFWQIVPYLVEEDGRQVIRYSSRSAANPQR